MAVDFRISVKTPEVGVRKAPAELPPGMAPSIPQTAVTAQRLDHLEGKTIYLVDTGFGGSYNFMVQLQKWFQQHLPSVTTIRKRKPGHVFMEDNASLWEEIKQKGDAVILGVAG